MFGGVAGHAGLFSNAYDLSLLYQMLLNGGELKGKRFLSAAAFKELTSRQTASGIKESYGLGLSVSPDGFGHGGAYSTNMDIDVKRGLITIFMVQHAGFPGDGKQSNGVFKKAAYASYGEPTRTEKK